MSIRSSRTRDSAGQRRDRPTIAVTRYDLVLALIPAAFLLALAAASVVGVALPTAFAAGSIVAVAAVTDALFLHPPTKSQ